MGLGAIGDKIVGCEIRCKEDCWWWVLNSRLGSDAIIGADSTGRSERLEYDVPTKGTGAAITIPVRRITSEKEFCVRCYHKQQGRDHESCIELIDCMSMLLGTNGMEG